MKSMKKVISDYKKPTPKKHRMIGDFSLVLIPVIMTSIGQAPEGTFTQKQEYWIMTLSTILLVAFKFFTNTYTNEKNNSGNDADSNNSDSAI